MPPSPGDDSNRRDTYVGLGVVALTFLLVAALAMTRPYWESDASGLGPGGEPTAVSMAPSSGSGAAAPGASEGAPTASTAGPGATPGLSTPTKTDGARGAPGVGAPARDFRLPEPPPAPTASALDRQLGADLPDRDLVELAARMGRTDGLAARTTDHPSGPYNLGDGANFWVHDIVSERYFQVPATLEAATDVAYIWIQEDHAVDQQQLTRGAEEFSNRIVPAVRDTFGSEWNPGVDGDPHMHILQHQPIAGIAGYYSSADEFVTAVEPHSNEHEMFYINTDVYTPGSYDWLALLSHEFQHMVHWNQDPNEAVWANEGLSELATIVAGYPAEDGGAYFSRPDTPLLEWNVDPTQNTPDYAASFAFMTFLFSHFGSDGIRHIVAAKGNGPNGIEEGLAADGQPHAFDDLFLDWIVANAVDDPKFLDGRFSYLGNPLGPVHPDPFDLGDGPNTVQPYATDYYDATPAVRGRRIDLQFQGDPTVGLLQRTSEATGAVWWSGRGDSGDARLTRSFDLTGLTEASLDFRMFHELEPNWDFAYYLVSTDNGGSWTRVATSRTTDDDPNGNNYGSGLTGYSDGWVDEELNLTPFVGGPVLVRLEVVTDDAVSLMGMAVDDIRLDAVGFRDDAEGDQGWTAEGWTRIVPVVPVRWAPQAIVFDGDGILGILRPRVADDGSAHFGADGIPEDARVIVAVSQITRGGRHPVAYTLAQRNDAQALLQPTGAAIIY